MAFSTWAAVRSGNWERSSDATPATMALAAQVLFIVW